MERLTDQDLGELRALCPGGVLTNVDLASISQWKIGGPADVLIRPSSTEEVTNLRRWFHERNMPHVVVGLTTNLLFADEGLRVPCLQIGPHMGAVNIEDRNVYAQAGAWVPGLARRLMKAGMTGGEHICGIPGTLGGLICMNGGSQRKGIAENVVTVESVDASGALLVRFAEDCGFDYRQSVFQRNNEIITSANMRFYPGARAAIRADMRAILAERRRKFPRKQPNCGSVFKSNPAMYADVGPPGQVIERLGLKGARIGGAEISRDHGNFIVNRGDAKARDVLELVGLISERIERATAYSLEAEGHYVSALGGVVPLDQAANELTQGGLSME
ncbi:MULTISPECIES: UDP-N-acetylmuramate dehydrogenase [Halorhodospira]|uniref:UDP-N-acetylmuramate dehydrogenase n=1 Tax=Halorhodospira TaxID=85108 RepID=UPI001EE81022|nr:MULTISPECIES: UDP-N-acetylmuramate dehydrogenase [Halorhodospira]MCG5528467.1 UDP-N-acetylmuramate dehydrogenase [Halorhodospira halophila]MCG5544516.1 UDP-N-acetylmuramate dehydrogenase [Halorhodospira sp. 9628]